MDIHEPMMDVEALKDRLKGLGSRLSEPGNWHYTWDVSDDLSAIEEASNLIESLRAQLEQSRPEVARWIPVSERLPEAEHCGVDILIAYENDRFLSDPWEPEYEIEVSQFDGEDFSSGSDPVYWQPITVPTPPKEQADTGEVQL